MCLQGASAIQRVLEHRSEKVRVFVIWEPVLATDWSSPSAANMRRVSDPRIQQYWDQGRLLSKAMGEQSRASIVWDWVGVYPPDAVWDGLPPKPAFSSKPVVADVAGLTHALDQTAATAR